MNALQRALQRREAIRRAAIQYHGWCRDSGDYALTPDEHWEASTLDQRAAAIELTAPIIEAYERVMASAYIFAEAPAVEADEVPA